MNNPRQYQQDRDSYRSRSRYRSAEVSRRFTARDYALPAVMLAVGLVVLTGTVVCACMGLFSSRNGRESLMSTAPGLADSSMQMMEAVEASELICERRVDAIIGTMTVEDKVGQLLLLRSHDIPDEDFCREITDTHAGGVVLFARDVKGRTAEELTAFIQLLQQASDGKMLVCVDEEGGTVVRVSSNRKLRDSSFRSPQKLYAEGGMEYIAYDAADKARFLHRFGINVNFAPVADVVTDPEAMMYDRAFGQDAAATAEYVATVVEASEAEGVGTCVKHFPGYGNTSGDTHNGIVTLDTGLEQLRQSDLLPFAAGIDAGCNAVMITHTIMSAIDPERPASMSPAVIGLLRDELGFEGVTVSDGMDMGAIEAYSDGEDVCVAAFLAGIDLMCTPKDGREAFTALLNAVNDGTVSAAQLDEAVRRILRWKLSLGLYTII